MSSSFEYELRAQTGTYDCRSFAKSLLYLGILPLKSLVEASTDRVAIEQSGLLMLVTLILLDSPNVLSPNYLQFLGDYEAI